MDYIPETVFEWFRNVFCANGQQTRPTKETTENGSKQQQEKTITAATK